MLTVIGTGCSGDGCRYDREAVESCVERRTEAVQFDCQQTTGMYCYGELPEWGIRHINECEEEGLVCEE